MLRLLLIACLLLANLPGLAQVANQRLVLKDGSYQVVTKYQRVGDRGRYFSAERSQWEEMPAELVDWTATQKYAKDIAPGPPPPAPQTPETQPPSAQTPASPANPEAAAIDKEEQAERARTPDVRPGLRLPDEEGIWALDTFRDQPELVAL